MPTPASVQTVAPSSLTVIGPTISHSPESWLKLQRALDAPGGRVSPVSGSGELDLEYLQAGDAQASVAGSGDIDLTATPEPAREPALTR